MSDDKKDMDNEIKDRSLAAVPHWVWILCGTFIVIPISISFSLLGVGMALKQGDFPVGDIANQYAQIDLKKAEFKLEQMRANNECPSNDVFNNDLSILVVGLIDRVEQLELIAHLPAKRKEK